ncbi:O-antigen biosynthesis protein rfbC [Vibrio ishigakensis]|uniref:O-antigen biosynthesis protein rfbC n=1 Tax=Vibrio ishigakensis TaxID=1481914 RepID=A0A0B8QA05_9VIBR|nr:O-antigen biosynthesis protein rfbC [Vibrio ishigakensis]
MLVFLPKTFERVLEIGCGEGGFRGNLPEETEYWGVEPDPVAVKKAMDVYVSDTFICGLFPQQQSKLPDDHFDVVVCNDIIEHVENTEELFYFLKKKLRSGGVLVASIPNVRHISHLKELLIKRDWEYKDSGILDRTHLRFLPRKASLICVNSKGLNLR